MADLGYDVWLGNFRGNVYCKRHVSRSPHGDQFWAFSWHENGYYDLKTIMDYVLAVAEQSSLQYVGHSMGTTALFVLLSTRPEYNQRVRIAALMAPVAYFTHLRGVLSLALPLFTSLEKELRNLHHEMFPRGTVPLSVINCLCRPESPSYRLCAAAYFQFSGPDMKQLNSTLFPVIMSHLPAGSSLDQFTHYSQVYKTGQFRLFDYGTRRNSIHYGQTQPPKYNLSNIVAPMAFYYSSGDYLSHQKDVETLIPQIPGTVSVYKIPLKDFNHGDYMWALDSYELLYKAVLKLLHQY